MSRLVLTQRFRGLTLPFVALVLVLAFLFTWSARFCQMHTADSILPALISTQKLTWYYWGQNRLGNLLPALVSWISDVDLNLKAQIFLHAACAAIAPSFFVLILRPKAPFVATYCAALAAILVLERDGLTHVFWTDAQPYATSLAILAACVRIALHFSWRLDRRSAERAIIILFLLVVALWVNLSAVLLIVPLFLGLAVVERSKTFALLTALTLLAYGLASAHAAYIGGANAYVAFQPSVGSTMTAITRLAEQIRLAPALLLVCGALWACWTLRSELNILRTALVLITVSLIAFLVTASLQWVQLNLSYARYFSFPLIGVIVTCSTLVAEAIGRSVASSRFETRACRAGLFSFPLIAAGFVALPLNMSCRFNDDSRLLWPAEEVARLAIDQGASFIGGEYWTVWPTVFIANRDAHRPIFGLTYRSEGAREAVRAYLSAHPHPVLLCVALPVAQCTEYLEQTLGRPLPGTARPIATGEIAAPKVSWVAVVLE